VHGIANQDLRDAPSFPEVWPRLAGLWHGKTVAIFNAEFDRRLLKQSRAAYGIKAGPEERPLQSLCIMETAQAYLGWRRWPSLGAAAWEFDVEPGDHSALADARAALGVLLAMAEGKKEEG
jgi:DNA polymerase-3 subunit epsilon